MLSTRDGSTAIAEVDWPAETAEQSQFTGARQSTESASLATSRSRTDGQSSAVIANTTLSRTVPSERR